ncbi:MAG: FAD-dependent oxidoreductase [Candidatus Polarisedimenticolia bacterium]
MKAVVLGGGVAGLTAGIALTRAGADTTIVESAPYPGGLAWGFRDRGYTFDLFSHRLWTRDSDVLSLVRECVGEPLVSRRKVSRILLDGRLYNYPIDLRDLLVGGSALFALRAAAGYASARFGKSPGGDDFRAYLVSRYGAPLFDVFFGPYTEKLCGCPPQDLSTDLAVGAVPDAGVLRQLVQRLIRRADPWDDFLYPARGFMEIPDGMARLFQTSGGRLLLGHRVERLLRRGGAIRSVEVRSGDGRLDLPADLVVSTIPLKGLLQALEPSAGPEPLASAAALRNRAMIGVYLGIARDRLTEDHWVYVPDPSIRFNRLSETTNYSPAMAPPGKTGLCLEVACDVGDGVWREDDEAQVRRAVNDLVKIGWIGSASEVEASWVRRAPSAYPVYKVGYDRHFAVIEASLRSIRNLHLCGRQGSFWYGSTAQGIRQALDLVAGIGLAASQVA